MDPMRMFVIKSGPREGAICLVSLDVRDMSALVRLTKDKWLSRFCMKYGLPEIQYNTPDKVMLFHQSLLERVRRLPGVRRAALVSAAPGSGPHGDRVFTIVERPAPSYSLQYDVRLLS